MVTLQICFYSMKQVTDFFIFLKQNKMPCFFVSLSLFTLHIKK
jgi:hypothetical protein